MTFADLNCAADQSHSARLLGCAAALRERCGSRLPARQQDKVDAVAKAVAATMTAADFNRLFGEGEELDPAALLDEV